MAFGPIVNLAGGYIQSLIMGGVNGLSPSSTSPTSTTGVAGATVSGMPQDTNQLSPFAQLLSTLQQLQQSNPTQYRQVTQQISNNLQAGAQSATAAGNTSLAGQLTQLASDFQNASTTGQLPNLQDLAQAAGGGRHHHHHGGSAGSTTNSSSSLDQLLQSLSSSETGSAAATSLSPLSIIDNTLSNAGISIG